MIKQWAEKDPEGALEWTNANLRGRHQARAIEELFATVIATDRDLAKQLFEKIAPGSARNEAARVIAVELFPSFSTGGINPEMDEEAITCFKTLNQDARDIALNHINFQWASTDPDSFKTYLMSELGSSIPDSQLNFAASNLAQENPSEMMIWSENFPLQQQTTIAKGAFQSWLKENPLNANQWFNDLPKDDARRPSMVEVYLDGFKNLNEDIAAERLRMLPKEDWKALDQLGLNAEKIDRIKDLAGK